MRTYNRIITAGLGLVAAITMAACGTDTTAAEPGTDSTPAATASAATTASAECTNNRADDEQINVRNELVGCKNLVVVTIVERNASYIVAPFQRPLVMQSRPKPGNATCVFHVVRADYAPGKEPADFRITWGSEVTLTGNVVGNDAREGAEIKPGPVTVKFKDLNRDWLLNKSGFDFQACGSLEQH